MELIEARDYRDRPINIEKSGRRKWIYAAKPMGKWYTRRSWVAYVLLSFLVIAPFIKIGGEPLMLLDIASKRFHILGTTFLPTDTFLLAVIMAVVVVSLVLVTVAFGRVFCGWACPQTLFLEFIYRRIEYWFNGDYRKQSRPNSEGIFKTIALHTLYLVVTLFFVLAFLNWFTGPQKLWQFLSSPLAENLTGFIAVAGVTLFYYFIYAHFREQVCTMVCPYGRMQGVLIDSNTISVIYDYKRGEPRGAGPVGDCIDCKRCIRVCPTGIDIKNGTQLECVNCTACIDECNTVMTKLGRPKNLIRYDSVNGIESGKRKLLSARSMAYLSVLAILFSVLIYTISAQTKVDASLFRLQGTMYQVVDSVTVSNMYKLKVINKTVGDKNLELKFETPISGTIETIGGSILLPDKGKSEHIVVIKMPTSQITHHSMPVVIGIYEGSERIVTVKTSFVGPNQP